MVPVYVYNLFLLIAFFLSLFVIWKRGREAHYDEEELITSTLAILGLSLVGARIAYVIIHFKELGGNVFSWVNVFTHPGFATIGGLIALVLSIWRFSKVKKWDAWQLADVLAAGMMLGKAVISIADLLMGIQFSGLVNWSVLVQLVELVWYGFIFVYVWRSESYWRTIGWYKGTKSEANSGYQSIVSALMTGLGMCVLMAFRPPRYIIADYRVDWIEPLMLIFLGLWFMHRRSGLGLGGITRYFLQEWGLTGSLVENWRRRKQNQEPERLRLGRDIF